MGQKQVKSSTQYKLQSKAQSDKNDESNKIIILSWQKSFRIPIRGRKRWIW